MIGAGCPNSMTAFGCLAGNDDFGTGCGPSGWQSQVTVAANSRWLYLIVEGYFGSVSGQYNVSW